MTREEINRLRPFNASMEMMLESTRNRLLRRGQAHHACLDKVPAARLVTLEVPDGLGVPFMTGILIGIGRNARRKDCTFCAIRKVQERYRHIQEVIGQNFRGKADTRFAEWPEPDHWISREQLPWRVSSLGLA